MSRDTLYRSVRSHLAYLKLAAAAEALPAELDAAMKNKRTHTELVDRLFAIEVAAVEARRHTGLLRLANFPPPWRLEDFDFTAQPSADPPHARMRGVATCRFADDATNVSRRPRVRTTTAKKVGARRRWTSSVSQQPGQCRPGTGATVSSMNRVRTNDRTRRMWDGCGMTRRSS